MALQKQLVSYNFLKGIDTKSDEYQVSGKLLELENGVFQSEGEVRKRNGYTTIGSSGALTSGNAIAGFNDEIVTLDGQNLYSFASQSDKFINKGKKQAVDIQRNSICKNNYSQAYANSTFHPSGLKLFVWIDGTNNTQKFSVIDTLTGNSIVNDQTISNFGVEAIATVGNYFVLIGYEFGSINDLKYISIPISTLVPSAPVTIANNLQPFSYNVEAVVLNNNIYCVYYNTALSLSIFTISSTLTVSAITNIPVTSVQELSIAADPILNQIWVSYQTNLFDVVYQVINSNFSIALAETIVENLFFIDSITISPYNGSAKIFYTSYDQISGLPFSGFTFSDPTQTVIYYLKSSTISNSGVVVNNGLLLRQAFAYSKAFYFNGKHHLVVLHESQLQNTYFLIDEDSNILAKMLPSNSGPNQFGFLVDVNKISTTKYSFAVVEKDFVTAQGGILFYNPGVAEEIITFNEPIITQNLGNNLHLSGGILSMYDGANVVEHGFNLFPEGLGYLVVNGGGTLPTTAPGQSFQYSQTYEWTDNQGQLHQSAPSVPITVETTDTGSLFGSGTIGLATLTTSSQELAQLKPGMKITGDNIPANTYIVSINSATTATVSNNFTGSFSGQRISIVAQDRILGNLTIDSKEIVIPPSAATTFYIIIDTIIFSNVITIRDATNLRVNQTIQSPVINSGSPTRITNINGNQVTLAATADYNTKNSFAAIYTTDTGLTATWVGGNNYFDLNTPAEAARYKDLELLYSTNAFTGTTSVQIVNVNTNTGRITIGGTMTAYAAGNAWSIAWPVNSFLKVGNTLTGTGLTGAQTIQEVNAFVYGSSGSGVGTVTITDAATATAAGAALTVNNVKSVQWYLPNLCLTNKIVNPVILSLWRTELNGTIFYRITNSNSASATLFNDVTQNFSFFIDDAPDLEIIGNDQLYTTGGVVENIEIPATNIITSYRSRLIGVPSESPYSIWYSKQVVPGNAVEFSDVFVQNIDQKGGPITGLATMDDKLILFKQSLIYYMVGDGPTATGINNDFTQPQLISTDSGCINKKSIVITPIGTMYQSAKGIYLLDRSLQVKYIGAEVEDYNNQTITSAQLVSNFNQVRFTLGNGLTLMYDYYYQQWSVFTNYSAIDATVIGASSTQATYYFIQSGGSVKKETNGLYLDDGAYIPLKMTTNWFSFAGLQGYERFYKVLILGHYHSPHSLNFKSYYDFGTTVQQDTTITVDSNPGVYQYRMFLNRQKCESVKFTLQDSALSPLGQGFSLSAIAFEVGVKQGLNKMPAASSYG